MRGAIALVALAFTGCANLSPAKQAQLDLLECRAQALAPAVEPIFDAVELARDLYRGRASLPAVLKSLEATEAEVRALVEALQACDAEPAGPGAVEAN